ncbi:sugar ABC transporter permease [Paenibacillus sp. MY03]|uniref:ABC transporter permease n=1 Tax=Paenibacillus sp. MY03 TaxID=302980 RepID=UPI000B3C82F6|nr:ABC transporter permease subunit [Paenibacillus sp. MY03]OUS76199.1 sugar ABC transporter permease [Paenibacillus sp. MY03]
MGFFKEIYRNRSLYTLALPGLLFLVIFAYIPMFGHLIAFKKFNATIGFWNSPWIGFKNFEFFFSSGQWLEVTWNTIFLNSLFIIFGLGLAVVMAILLNEIRLAIVKRFAQSIIFMPYFISWMVVSLMVYALLNTTDGMINQMLKSLGMDAVGWYNNANFWPSILTIVYVWKMAGYYSIIFLASITGISSDYYESARIDGATRFQQIRHITLPLIRPTIIVLALLAVGRIFYGDFAMIYGIIGDNAALFSTTDVIDTFSYRALRQLGDFGMSSSVALYQSIMGVVAIILFNWIIRKVDKDSALF